MSQSPRKMQASRQYRDGWRAVNMLIRSDGSWSGRERKSCYRNLGDGRFEDVSFISGLDLQDDGRSWVNLDVDGDGGQDLVMSFRTGPRLRVFRNESAMRGVTLDLGGAVGARVTLVTSKRRLHRQVRSGSGFLSQSSRRLHFGLDPGEQIRTAEVTWPSGSRQSFQMTAGTYRLVEGKAGGTPLEFAAPPPVEPPPAVIPSLWLAEPAPLSGWQAGRTLVALYADWCPPCRVERAELTVAAARISAAGLRVRFLNVDDAANRGAVAALSLLHRNLFDRRVDPALPVSFLIDSGQLVKVYKGAVTVAALLADARVTARVAFPFPGDWYGEQPRRNWIELATAMAEHGLTAEAAPYLEAALAAGSTDPRVRNNLAGVLIESGTFDRAGTLLRESLKTRPDQVEALANLGTVELRLNRPHEAIRIFERALSIQPDDAYIHNGLGSAWFATGDFARASTLYAEAVRLAPDSSEYRANLGSVLAQTGKLKEALAEFEVARKLRGDSVDLLNNLGILYIETGQRDRGIQCFQQALKLDPAHAATKTNLQRALAALK